MTSPNSSASTTASSTRDTPGGAVLCNVLGFVLLLAGLYFLIVAPGIPNADAMPDSLGAIRIVNFQRLAMGQAFTVAGAIFLAAAWRPRR